MESAMRIVSAKSLCVLFGVLVPCLGATTQAEAGVIPWLYDSIFGYGWGGGYGGGGYGGGMQYGAGYGGGYGMGYSSPMYSSPVYSAPVMSSPVAPTDGTYNSLYGPSLGYYDSGYGGYGSSYVVNSGNCCTPCSACTTGDCATSIESSKPAPNPTPADKVVPVVPRRTLPPDEFGPTNPGTGLQGTGVRGRDLNGGEALPETERRPGRQLNNGLVEPVVPPAEAEPPVDNAPPAGNLMQVVPHDRNIAVRYVPISQRSLVVIPRSTARVVRIDRAMREQLSQTEPKPQLASNP